MVFVSSSMHYLLCLVKRFHFFPITCQVAHGWFRTCCRMHGRRSGTPLQMCWQHLFHSVFNLTIFPKVVNPSLGKTVSSSLFLRSRIQLWPSMSSVVKQKLAISIEDKRSNLPSTYHKYHRQKVLGR